MATTNNTVKNINVVEFSHHDLGWHKCALDAEAQFTFDEINSALDRMNEEPDFTWTHECGKFFYDYVNKYPERLEEVKKRVLEGRLDLGAGYCMPYTSFLSSEMLARQFIYGKKWVEDLIPGTNAAIYYNTDVPGIGTQMPQLMAKSGVDYFYASRSWNFDDYNLNEFKLWKSPDGSSIRTFFMNHYGTAYLGASDGAPARFTFNDYPERIVSDYEEDKAACHLGDEAPLVYSMDCMMPTDLRGRMEEWNAYAEKHNLPKMKYSTLKAALDNAFDKDADLSNDVLEGEWPSKWFYENSASGHEVFRNQRDAGRLLTAAETLFVLRAIATGSFADYPSDRFEKGWRDADHSCHGYAPQSCIESFKETYQAAYDTAKALYEEGIQWLSAAVRTEKAKGDLSFLVYNSASHLRTDVVLMDRPYDGEFAVFTADGKEVTYQPTDDGRIVFVAEDVPSLGYSVYYIKKNIAPSVSGTKFDVNAAWTAPFQNRFYTVSPVAEGGALDSVIDRENGGKSVFSTDKFKIGELYDFRYDGMGAGEQLVMWQPHDGESQLKAFAPWTCTESGPVRTVFETKAEHASRGPVVIRLSVYEAVKQLSLDVKVTMDEAEARQLRLMFPVNAGDMFGADNMIDHSKVAVSYEAPYGAVTVGDEVLPRYSAFNRNTGDPNNVGGSISKIRDFSNNSAARPREVQNWVRAADADKDSSVTISSYVIGWDYQDPTPEPCRTPVLQAVLASTSQACHWEYGHWLQPGEHVYHFTLTSGKADCTCGKKMCADANSPLDARMTGEGTLLPETCSACSADCDHVIITAVKKAEDSDRVVVRYYESEGCKCTDSVKLTLPAEVCCAKGVNIIERDEAENRFSAEGNTVTGPVSPWSIETAMLGIKDMK